MQCYLPLKHCKIMYDFRCIDPSDDPYRACFGCDTAAPRDDSNFDDFIYDTFGDLIDRQSGERFMVTRQSRRLICRRSPFGGLSCKLRVDRAMQFRRATYARVQQFVQSEQYLSNDDIDFLIYFTRSFRNII